MIRNALTTAIVLGLAISGTQASAQNPPNCDVETSLEARQKHVVSGRRDSYAKAVTNKTVNPACALQEVKVVLTLHGQTDEATSYNPEAWLERFTPSVSLGWHTARSRHYFTFPLPGIPWIQLAPHEVEFEITNWADDGGGGGGGDDPPLDYCDQFYVNDCWWDWGEWDYEKCECAIPYNDPILIPLGGAALHVTSLAKGVGFDFDGDGRRERTAWTAGRANLGFLVLDGNGNGRIDDGTEMFSQFTVQSRLSQTRQNGFLALGEHDAVDRGGNSDGMISVLDSVWPRLQLWIDRNHNGRSEPNELLLLSEAGVEAISLGFVGTGNTNGATAATRFAGTVKFVDGASSEAWDVFLDTSERRNRKHK